MRYYEDIIGKLNLRELFRMMDIRYKVTFFSTLLWGLLAHGMVMFNHFYYHDDMADLFGEDKLHLVQSGRWFLSFLAATNQYLTGFPDYILPLVDCTLSLLIIGLVSCLIVGSLNIRTRKAAFLTGAIMSVYPSVTCSFGYLNTTPYYMLSLLMAMTGVILCCKKESTSWRITGILLMSLSMSIYQAYLPFILAFFLLFIIKEIVDKPNIIQAQKVIKKIIMFLFYITCACILYLMTLKLSLLIMDMTMTSYNGADHWSLNLQDYLSRIIVAYKKFFIVDWTLFIDRRLYFVFIVLLLFLMMRTIITVYKQNRGNGILLTGLFCLFPMIISFIYVMCPLDTIHALMLYSNTLVFILFFYLGERLELSTLVRGISTFLSALLIYTFVKYDNACYMKAMFNQHQAISYFTTLVTRIKSLPGYTDEKTVVFIGEGRVRDKSLAVPSEDSPFHMIKLLPFWDVDAYINNYAWLKYMKYWCGYAPILGNSEYYEKIPEVKNMPTYPDDGSIAVVNDIIVIKLGE